MDSVLFSKEGQLARIVLNRPEKLNAISVEMRHAMMRMLDEAEGDSEVRALSISGNGKAFSAGADVSDLHGIASKKSLEEREQASRGDTITDLGMRIRSLDIPVIAEVHGYCLGGGFELVQFCDMVYCTEDAVFGQPEVRIGIIPGGGGTQNLPRIAGQRAAREMVFTARRIGAQEALRLGVVNRVFGGQDEMHRYVMDTVSEISQAPRVTIAYAKRAMNATLSTPIQDGLAFERHLVKALFGSPETERLMSAFLSRQGHR